MTHPLADNCPHCRTRTTPWTFALIANGDEAHAGYRCPRCGWTWSCGWLMHSLGPEGRAFVYEWAA